MIIRNKIFDEYVNPQDALGLHADSGNLFPAMYMNSDCERFDKFDEIYEFDPKFFDIDKDNNIFRPKLGYRASTFTDPNDDQYSTFNNSDLTNKINQMMYDKFGYDNNLFTNDKNLLNINSYDHGGYAWNEPTAHHYLLFTNLYQYYAYNSILKNYTNITLQEIISATNLTTNYIDVVKDLELDTPKKLHNYIINAKYKNALSYNDVDIYYSYDVDNKFANDIERKLSGRIEKFDEHMRVINFDLEPVDSTKVFNNFDNDNDKNTISMRSLYDLHEYVDNADKLYRYRSNIRYKSPAYNKINVSAEQDENYIKPIDMYVGTHELMRKGTLPAFFMGINDTGMTFDFRSYKAPNSIYNYSLNGFYLKQHRLSFSGFTGKRYALYNRTIKPYLDNDITIGSNTIKNKEVAANILYKICNGSTYSEWLSLNDCKAIVEANYIGGSVDLLSDKLHLEIDKRLFADIDTKFPKFLNYYKNIDIGVQTFMIEDLNNMAILMPYGEHTFVSIDNDENHDVDNIEFTMSINANTPTEGNLYYIENIGWMSYYIVAKIPNDTSTAYTYLVKFKVTYDPDNRLTETQLDNMDNVTVAGFDARCFMLQSKYNHLFTDNMTSFKEIPIISPLLILGGAQVTEIQGPIFQFNVDKLEFAKSINKIIRTIDIVTDPVSTICKDYAVFTVMNSATRDIGSMIHVLFTLYGLHGDWNFILDRMGTVVKADKAFDKILSIINKNQTEYEAFFKEYMTANQQYSPRKNPYAYLTKVDCYAANIANNFDSLTDEFTFIGPMVDDKDVYDNYPNSKGWEPLMPHVNNGAVGFQAEIRAFIFNKDLKYKLDDMKHNVTNRWYVAPHSYTRKQYDMTNAYCVGSDFDVIIKPKYSFFTKDLNPDKFQDIYKDKYTRFKYHILSPEYAYTQNVLTFGYRIKENILMINGLECYIPFDSYEKIIINYHNHEDIFRPGVAINKDNYPNAYIFSSTRESTIANEMIYISYVFDPNKKYNFQGWSSLDDNTIEKYKNLFFFKQLESSLPTYNQVNLVSITGTFPNMSDPGLMHQTSGTVDSLNRAIERSPVLNKWFEKVNFSNVEVLGDRLFENWYGDIPMYMIGKCTNLKVVPQSLYHSSFSHIIKLPPKVEVIPDYIWDNKYIDYYNIEALSTDRLLRYIVEPAGNTNSVFFYKGYAQDIAHTSLAINNIGTKGDFIMPWNESPVTVDEDYYRDVNIRDMYTRMYNNNFIGKQFVTYKSNFSNRSYDEGYRDTRNTVVTILCNKYFKPMSGASYNYHRMNLSENIEGIKLGKMRFNDVVKFVSWVPNYFVGWQHDEFLERFLAYWAENMWDKVDKSLPYKTQMSDYGMRIRTSLGIYNTTAVPEAQRKVIQVKYHPEWYKNLIIFKPLRYGLDSICPDLLSKGAETLKNVYQTADDINSMKTPHLANNTRWNEYIAYHPAFAFYSHYRGENFEKLSYKEGFYEETLGNVLWINSGLTTDIYKQRYQYIPFEDKYYGRSYKWNSGDKFNHFDIKSVLMSYIDKIVLPQRSATNIPGNEANKMLWNENSGFQLVNRSGNVRFNIDPYDNLQNSQYYNYIDRTRKAKKQYKYSKNMLKSGVLDASKIAATNFSVFFTNTKYPINAYPELIEDWSEQVAEHGDQWLGYRSDALMHANNLLMVYDYQKFMDSPFFERTDIALENYGAYDREYKKSAEFAMYPTPWNMSRRDGSGLITGMLVPPVFNVLGSNDNKNNDVKTLWSTTELPGFVDNQTPNTINFKRNFNMVKNILYSNGRILNFNDITVYKRANNYDNAIEFLHSSVARRNKITDTSNTLFNTIPPVPNIAQNVATTTFDFVKGINEWQNLFLYCAFPSYVSLENSINTSDVAYIDKYRRGHRYMHNNYYVYTKPPIVTTPEVAAVASSPYERVEVKINVPTKFTTFMDYNNAIDNTKSPKYADILDDIRWVDMYNGINNTSDLYNIEANNYTEDPKYYIKVLMAQKNRPNVNNLNVFPDQFALNWKMASTPTVPALTSVRCIGWRDAYYIHPCKIYEVSMSRTLGFRHVFEKDLSRMYQDTYGIIYQLQYNSIQIYNRFKQSYRFISDNDDFTMSDIYDRNINRVISINRQGEMGNHLLATNYGRVIDESNKTMYAGASQNPDKDFITLDYRNNQHGLGHTRNIVNLSSINQYPEFTKILFRETGKGAPYSKSMIFNTINMYYNNQLDNNTIYNSLYNLLFSQVYANDQAAGNTKISRDTRFNIRTHVNYINGSSEAVTGYSRYYDNVYNVRNTAVKYTLDFANTSQKQALTDGGGWWNANIAMSNKPRTNNENNQLVGAFKHIISYFRNSPPNVTRWISTNMYFEGPLVYSVGSGEFMKVYQDTFNIAAMRLHINFNNMWNTTQQSLNRDKFREQVLIPTNESSNYRQGIPYREILTRVAHGWGGFGEDTAKMRTRDAIYGLWMYLDCTLTGTMTYGYNDASISNTFQGVEPMGRSIEIPDTEANNTKKNPKYYELFELVRTMAGKRYNNKWTRYNTSMDKEIPINNPSFKTFNINNLFRNTTTIFKGPIFEKNSDTVSYRISSANNVYDIGYYSGGKNYYDVPILKAKFTNMMNMSRPVTNISTKHNNSIYLLPPEDLQYVDDLSFIPQYTSNIENLYYNIEKNVVNNEKFYEGTMVDKLYPLKHYSYARDVYGYLNTIKVDAPQVPDSILAGSPEKMYSRNTFSKLTGLTFNLPSGRNSVNLDLGVVNIYNFESVKGGRKLNTCKFEFYPLIDDPSHLLKEEGLAILIDGVEYRSGWDPINIIMENNTFEVDNLDKVEITIKSYKYNWVVRVVPATNQNDKREPVVTINLPFVAIHDNTFTYQSLTRMNPFIDKYDIGGFVESYKPGGNNLANIVPLILIFGRIKDIPTNIFEEVRSKNGSNIGVTFISTLAGSHVKKKWDINILTPIRKIAELTDNPLHKLAALMFRMVDNNDEDPILTPENSWFNDGIEGPDAISGDIYELIYGNEIENPYQVIESMPEDIKNDYLEKFYSGDDSWFDWAKEKISSNQKDQIVPILFTNCGNNNGFTVSTNVFQNYHIWCKNRNLSDKKIMFIGMFAGSYIKAVPQYLNGVDINTKAQYEDISEMPIWSASEPSKGHILFDHTINSIGKHKDINNANILQRPHIVFMGYLPNDFTYAFCPLLVLNNDTINESYIGTDTMVPRDSTNMHIVNHRGQYINCTISGTLDIHKMLELYKNGNDLHIMQLTFGQFDTKQTFFNMIVRIDSSLSNKQIQTYSTKILDLVKYVKVRFIPENAFRFKWFNSNNKNKFSIYADYFLFGRKALINIINTGNEFLHPNNSYRRGFTNCINLERIPDNLIPMEYVVKDFSNFLSFIEMFNGCKTYVPTTVFRNPNNISSGFIMNLNVTNIFRDDYFLIEIDKDTNIVENMNGIDIKAFGKMTEVTATIAEDKIRKLKNIPNNYNIIFKEFLAHPEAENNRWIPFFYCRVVMYCKIPK